MYKILWMSHFCNYVQFTENFNFVYSIIRYNLNFFDSFKTGFSTDFTRILFRVYEYTSAWFSINDTVSNRFVCVGRVFNLVVNHIRIKWTIIMDDHAWRVVNYYEYMIWISRTCCLFVFDIFISPDETMIEQITIGRIGLISHPVVLLQFSINCESSNKYRQQFEFTHRFNLNQKRRSIHQFLLVYFFW